MARTEEELLEWEQQLREAEEALAKRKTKSEVELQPGQGVLFQTTKTKATSSDWDGQAILPCEACNHDTRYQMLNWDNGKRRDLRFRVYKEKPTH